MNKGNSASLSVSLLLIVGLCLALMPTTAQAADIPSDTNFGDWDPATNTYTLNTNLTEGIVIDADNFTLDGNGHTVTGTGEGTGSGVYLHGRTGVTTKNLTVQSFEYGISLYVNNDTTLKGNTASNNTRYGIYLNSATDSELIDNNVSGNISDGIYLSSCGFNTIYNNYFNNATNVGFAGTIYSNTWNTTKTPGTNIVGGPYLGGNFWAKPDGTGFSQTHPDGKGDGFCDQVYTLATRNVDNLPLAPYSLVSLSIVIYPNPSSVNEGGLVTFSNFPLESEIRVYIYDLGGSLVKVLEENDTVIEGGSKTVTWDLKNDREEMVARGIYIYFIPGASEKRTGKIAIIK